MKNLMIVDDSSTVRSVIANMLKNYSFHFFQAEDGLRALDIVDDYPMEAIILDWHMPHMDGLTFLKKFKERPDSKHTKVIFCTTENEIEKIQTAIDFGADEYIMKPFDGDLLVEKLRQVGII